MSKIPFFLLLVFILSCSTEIDEGKIFISEGIYILLEDNETIDQRTKENTDLYFSYVGNSDIQAPLYKYITHEEYQLFVGLPIDEDFDTLKDMLISSDATEGKLESKSTSYVYSNYKLDSINITKYLAEIDKSIVLIIIASDTDKKLDVSELESINKRIVNEK